ncbi:MAG: preprotein translocase subunit SecE [Patescibacteria group bacterium]
MINKLTSYLRESKDEMRKVVWPTRQQTIRYTLMVLGVTVIMAAFLGTLDFVFTIVLDRIIT